MKELRAYLRLAAGALLPLALFLFLTLRLRSDPEPAPEPLPTPEATEAPTPSPAPGPDRQRRVTLLTEEGELSITMEDYLFGVVAAEMPASFPLEALKAQAAAARTDTVWRQNGHSPHPAGVCCADPGCCKAWFSEAQLRERWGADYDRWAAVVRRAVAETDGAILVYDGEPIFAAFHACSDGSTEASENVWVQALPYLRSVPSPETAETVPDFCSGLSVSYNELRRLALASYPEADLSGPGAEWLTGAEYTESGRLLRVILGGVTLTGNQLRFLLGLRSAAVTWTCGETEIRFSVRGYGHGVGMSQYGARQMALEGADWRAILAHYYPGTTLVTE